MTTKYVQKGSSIDYTNSGTAVIHAGDIVTLGTRIGVAATDIAVGAVGAVAVCGVFAAPKASGAVTVGSALYYDSTNKNITTTASTGSGETKVDNTPAGWAVAPAASADTEVLVKIG